MIPRKLWLFVAAAVIPIVAISAYSKAASRIAARKADSEMRSLFVNRSENVYRALLPEADTLVFSVPERSWPYTGIGIVECEDAAGNYVGTCVWDRQTGELSNVSFLRPGEAEPRGPIADRRQAADAGWESLTAIGLAGKTTRWRFVGARREPANRWLVTFRTSRRRATVSLAARTGEVYAATVFAVDQQDAGRRQAGHGTRHRPRGDERARTGHRVPFNAAPPSGGVPARPRATISI